MAAAQAALQGPWKKFTAAARGDCLLKLAELLLEHKEEMAWLDATPIGKPEAFSKMEVDMGVSIFKCKQRRTHPHT